jgi:hypothetical protein
MCLLVTMAIMNAENGIRNKHSTITKGHLFVIWNGLTLDRSLSTMPETCSSLQLARPPPACNLPLGVRLNRPAATPQCRLGLGMCRVQTHVHVYFNWHTRTCLAKFEVHAHAIHIDPESRLVSGASRKVRLQNRHRRWSSRGFFLFLTIGS